MRTCHQIRPMRWSAFRLFASVFTPLLSRWVTSRGSTSSHTCTIRMPWRRAPMAADEHTMLGLYTISLLDDVTHGLSARRLPDCRTGVGTLHSRLALDCVWLVLRVRRDNLPGDWNSAAEAIRREFWLERAARGHQQHHDFSGVSRAGECAAGVGAVTSVCNPMDTLPRTRCSLPN